MIGYFAPSALLPGGWSDDVLIAVDDDGFIRSTEANRRPPHDAVILPGAVLPGMANLHSHAFQRAMAGLAERTEAAGRDSFGTWRDTMYRFLAGLDPERTGAIAAQLYLEMLKAGYTSVAEFHYLHHQVDGTPYDDPCEMAHGIVEAAARTGIAITLLPVLYVHGGFDAAPPAPEQRRFVSTPDRFLRMFERLHTLHDGSRGVRLGIAPHSVRAVDARTLAGILPAIDRLDRSAPIHIHIAEQLPEVLDCVRATGARPVAWLFDNVPVDERWCLVHATHSNRAEIGMIARSRAVAGLCPTTEANLGDGVFPLGRFLAAGGRLGIGSDSHVSTSPVEELRWLEYTHRLRRRRRLVTATDSEPHAGARLWNAALAGGAQALGLPTGSLREGSRADLICLDRDHPLLYGRTGNDLLDSFVFSGNGNPVIDVVVGGRHVVRQGRHEDEDEVARAYREAVDALAA